MRNGRRILELELSMKPFREKLFRLTSSEGLAAHFESWAKILKVKFLIRSLETAMSQPCIEVIVAAIFDAFYPIVNVFTRRTWLFPCFDLAVARAMS